MSATLQRLELALLFVFQNFRKAYIGEQANVSSTNLYSRLAERVGIADHVTVMDVIMNKTMSNLKVCMSLHVRACVRACVHFCFRCVNMAFGKYTNQVTSKGILKKHVSIMDIVCFSGPVLCSMYISRHPMLKYLCHLFVCKGQAKDSPCTQTNDSPHTQTKDRK